MKEERLRVLFDGWLAGRLTPPEEAEWLLLVADPQLEEARQELIGKAYELPIQYAMEPEAAQALFLRIRTPRLAKRVTLKTWIRVAAAIFVLVALSGGVWRMLHPRPTAPISTAPVLAAGDVPPGGNKATLTLGNGTRIILDSASVGTLAREAGSTVTKTDSGKLSYMATKGKAVEVVYNTLSTPRGGQYQLTLPDGTRVWLNAASSITYPTAFAGDDRKVQMTGEAYFEVAHQTGKPFRVQAGSTTMEDLGTSFDVDAYADEPSMKTTLVEGALRIGALRLEPGQQADLRPGSPIRLIRNADVEQALAWKNGLFHFGHADLKTVLRQVSRWYDLDIDYGPASGQKEIHLSGIISRNIPASGVLRLLESNGARFTLKGKTLIVQ